MFICILTDYSKTYSFLGGWPRGHVAAAERSVLNEGVLS